MSAQDLVVDSLLVLAVASAAVCVLGLLAGRAAIDRLHYAGAATSVPPALIAAAVVADQGISAPSLNAIVVALLLLVLGSVLTHATARVARGRRR
jgi:multisubunit Na+/H+ antiporter MnhG subunit